MIGEIRDSETGEIALQSALTGHLLLSTLHTNDATSSLTRLMDMGIADYLISSTLLGVLAQRLVRKLCEDCKEDTTLASVVIKDLNISIDATPKKAVGCSKCDFTGYKGRVAVGELFIINDDVKEMIKEKYSDYEIRMAMKSKGMVTIADQLKELIENGITSYEETLRVGIMDG